MSYGDLVYKLGKRYTKERERQFDTEFPYFSGLLSELLDDATLRALPDLEGEHVIAYSADGVQHLIRVYFDGDLFEAEGTPSTNGTFHISVDIENNSEDTD